MLGACVHLPQMTDSSTHQKTDRYVKAVHAESPADGDNQLIESDVVSEYLDSQYKSTGTKLFPEDPLQLAKVAPAYICSFTDSVKGGYGW